MKTVIREHGSSQLNHTHAFFLILAVLSKVFLHSPHGMINIHVLMETIQYNYFSCYTKVNPEVLFSLRSVAVNTRPTSMEGAVISIRLKCSRLMLSTTGLGTPVKNKYKNKYVIMRPALTSIDS